MKRPRTKLMKNKRSESKWMENQKRYTDELIEGRCVYRAGGVEDVVWINLSLEPQPHGSEGRPNLKVGVDAWVALETPKVVLLGSVG